jgi:hypothetical protein
MDGLISQAVTKYSLEKRQLLRDADPALKDRQM